MPTKRWRASIDATRLGACLYDSPVLRCDSPRSRAPCSWFLHGRSRRAGAGGLQAPWLKSTTRPLPCMIFWALVPLLCSVVLCSEVRFYRQSTPARIDTWVHISGSGHEPNGLAEDAVVVELLGEAHGRVWLRSVEASVIGRSRWWRGVMRVAEVMVTVVLVTQ